jgi:hypothetical protein
MKICTNSQFPELMKQLGLVPEDTNFNRRAAVYAKEAAQQSYYQNRKSIKASAFVPTQKEKDTKS